MNPHVKKNGRENFLLLKLVAVRTVEILEEITQDALRKHNKSGRPPTSWKSDFVWWLANLWRIVTGEDASKDLASPFASFVAAAWASLRNDLPEIPWASQIRRRRDILPAADLVKWANSIRDYAIRESQSHLLNSQPIHLMQTSGGAVGQQRSCAV